MYIHVLIDGNSIVY